MPFSLVGDDVIGEDFFWTNLPWGKGKWWSRIKSLCAILASPKVQEYIGRAEEIAKFCLGGHLRRRLCQGWARTYPHPGFIPEPPYREAERIPCGARSVKMQGFSCRKACL